MEKKKNHEVQMDRKGIYTLRDMANMFSVSVRTIYNWLDEGRFSFVKTGSKTYVTEAQLQEFLESNTVNTSRIRRAAL